MPRGFLPAGRPDRDIQNWRYLMQRRFKAIATPEEVDEIITTGIEKAKSGDVQWAGLIFPFIFGRLPKGDDDGPQLDVSVNGNVNLIMNELPIEQLEALAAFNTARVKYTTLNPELDLEALREPDAGAGE